LRPGIRLEVAEANTLREDDNAGAGGNSIIRSADIIELLRPKKNGWDRRSRDVPA